MKNFVGPGNLNNMDSIVMEINTSNYTAIVS